ncbi:MAG: hypothetical protein H0W76_27020 [Pyrinomonadaceae bacterium]|nr:hypothetical protein [Pyrinomonadaceae bacterium]
MAYYHEHRQWCGPFPRAGEIPTGVLCVCGHTLDDHEQHRFLWACTVEGCECPDFERDGDGAERRAA